MFTVCFKGDKFDEDTFVKVAERLLSFKRPDGQLYCGWFNCLKEDVSYVRYNLREMQMSLFKAHALCEMPSIGIIKNKAVVENPNEPPTDVIHAAFKAAERPITADSYPFHDFINFKLPELMS